MCIARIAHRSHAEGFLKSGHVFILLHSVTSSRVPIFVALADERLTEKLNGRNGKDRPSAKIEPHENFPVYGVMFPWLVDITLYHAIILL